VKRGITNVLDKAGAGFEDTCLVVRVCGSRILFLFMKHNGVRTHVVVRGSKIAIIRRIINGKRKVDIFLFEFCDGIYALSIFR